MARVDEAASGVDILRRYHSPEQMSSVAAIVCDQDQGFRTKTLRSISRQRTDDLQQIQGGQQISFINQSVGLPESVGK
ncbi:MAG: hypothetical protein IPK32_05700 [Verrucomicrobiaceae bacterium]|nr:hypothetical protein [Verrucomicrobiaceae bacterium]